jgi:hypothetical protein
MRMTGITLFRSTFAARSAGWPGLPVLVSVVLLLFPRAGFAHPASGIVVDDQGRVYILYHGLDRVEPSGELTTIEENSGGHWLALGSKNIISGIALDAYKRVFADGNSFLFGDGAPLAFGADGSLYYASDGSSELMPVGALSVVRLSPGGKRSAFSPALQAKLADLGDGVTALAVGSDGRVYAGTWKGFIELHDDGSTARIFYPLPVQDCDSDPADHNPANASSPYFRGIGVDAAGNVYLAATSCHRVLKVERSGKVSILLRSERPWAPTGLTVHGQDIYVLEYTNANGPRTEGWYPRVRRVSREGPVETLLTVHPSSALPDQRK